MGYKLKVRMFPPEYRGANRANRKESATARSLALQAAKSVCHAMPGTKGRDTMRSCVRPLADALYTSYLRGVKSATDLRRIRSAGHRVKNMLAPVRR